MITSITNNSVVLINRSADGCSFLFPSREASEVALLTAIPNRPVLLRAFQRKSERERERERKKERARREDENRVYDILVPPAPVYQHRDRKWT
jgi:hypothetical protein